MAHAGQFSNKNPGTSHMDQRGAKIFEIYSSGKSGGGGASHIGSNVSTGSGGGHSGMNAGSQSHQNSFLQNKYQFATYYGQKNYPSGNNNSSQISNPHHQYNGSLVSSSVPTNNSSNMANLSNQGHNLANNNIGTTSTGSNNGMLGGSQYEYSIEGQVDPIRSN